GLDRRLAEASHGPRLLVAFQPLAAARLADRPRRQADVRPRLQRRRAGPDGATGAGAESEGRGEGLRRVRPAAKSLRRRRRVLRPRRAEAVRLLAYDAKPAMTRPSMKRTL